jgi:hypothetical protein
MAVSIEQIGRYLESVIEIAENAGNVWSPNEDQAASIANVYDGSIRELVAAIKAGKVEEYIEREIGG